MSRRELDRETLNALGSNVPDIEELFELIKVLAPDVISSSFPSESTVPIAAVCLRDIYDVLWEAQYALFEVFAHRVAYVERKPNHSAAILFGRYYATDAALRLYSAAIHLDAAIVAMFEISGSDLKPAKRVRIRNASVLSKLRYYLIEYQPDHAITKAIDDLEGDAAWQQTVEYRNRWVHQQPPTLEGLGIVWKRYKRWKVDTEHGHRLLEFGGGDAPDYSIDELIAFVQAAMFRFFGTTRSVVESYREMLQENGLTLSRESISFTMGGTLHEN